MKKGISALLCALSLGLSAQTSTELVLNISHMNGQNALTASAVGTNNLGNQFTFSRLQYYVDDVQVEYNTDSVYHYPSVLLIDALGGDTRVALGNVSDVDSVTAIRFAVGVGPDVNNLDPSTYAPAHPLAPKNPSMHWGWAAGYRFVCAEGMASANFDQGFELHGLGNDNYAMQTIPTSGTAGAGDTLELGLVADYSKLVKNIAVAQGVISHGETGDAYQALKNLNNDVFTSSEGNLALGQLENAPQEIAVNIYPNPSAGPVTVAAAPGAQLEIFNAVGNVVMRRTFATNPLQLELAPAGVYLVKITSNGTTTIKKLIVR